MFEIANSERVIRVKNSYYKPFWMNGFMYFVNFHSGKLFTFTPIHLGGKDYANMSNLINYFQENDIEILDSRSII